MQAQIVEQWGPPSVFKQVFIPKPQVPPRGLLIQVMATSVNPIDCKIRAGVASEVAPALPAVLHGDVAGVVAEVGSQVKDWRVGEEVYACAGGVRGTGGALAEWMVADSDCVAKKPKTLSFREAAALPLITLTAWTALFLKGAIWPGCRLVVHGGVGGVGHIAVQLGKWAGAEVSATVGSEEDLLLVSKLGAQHGINFRKETVPDYVQRVTQGKGFEVIFDTVGGKNLELSFQAASMNGAIVTTAARSTNDLTLMHHKGLSLHVISILLPLLHGVGRKEQGEILEKAASLVEEGAVRPLMDPRRFLISEVAEAHAYVESGQSKGKVVLEGF